MREENTNENVMISHPDVWGAFSEHFMLDRARLIEMFGDFFATFFLWLQIVSLFVSLFLTLGIIYSLIRISQVRAKEKEWYQNAIVPIAGDVSDKPLPEGNERWERVLKLAASESETDWRLAIIEADIVLNDLVSRMQYPGETLGEKLKGVERSDFLTLDNAWEAHKVRNEIAHSGSDFVLSRRLVDKTINNYKLVFEEFHFI